MTSLPLVVHSSGMDLTPLDEAATAVTVDLGPDPEPVCRIPWDAEGHAAIEVFVERRLLDRADDLCATVEDLAAVHPSLESLELALGAVAGEMGVGVSVLDPPPDGTAADTVALGMTLG
jgi:hypothetical protein